MATPTKFLEQPARGSLSGVWDTPVNNNMGIIDASFGGVATIALASTGVVLSQSQYQCAIIRLIGNLTTEIPLQFPAVGGHWIIINECTNFNNAVPYMYTGAGNYLGIPPGQSHIVSDGANMRYLHLPPVGTYMTIASNNYPRWVLLNPVFPYLNCDGSAFNTSTYNRLAEYLGFGTTPDLRGRAHYTTDQGTGRVTAIIAGGFTGAGGDQYLQYHTHGYSNSVFVSFNVNTSFSQQDINHTHTFNAGFPVGASPFSGGNAQCALQGGTTAGPDRDMNQHSHNVGAGMSGGFSGGTDGGGTAIGSGHNMPPSYMMGLTLIRTGYP